MFRSLTNHLYFLLPDSPMKDNWGEKNNAVYTSRLDATLWAKAWHLPAGAAFLDPCQTLRVNKETLGERQHRVETLRLPRTPAPLLLHALCAPQA